MVKNKGKTKSKYSYAVYRRAILIVATLLVFFLTAASSYATTTIYVNWFGDNQYPQYIGKPQEKTGPLPAFEASDLKAGWGTPEKANIVFGVMDTLSEDFKEFDVSIVLMKPSSGNFQYLGIGSDSYKKGSGVLYGKADEVDTDSTDMDYARVWAGSFALQSEFQGSNATVPRFINAIAGTAAHELAHNYGANHSDASPTSAEANAGDSSDNHLLASSNNPDQLTREERATIDRHFSDTTYSILAQNIGLNQNTLVNWDFKNSNSTAANDFHIIFLSEHSSLTKKALYSGSPNPFADFTTTNLGQVNFKGKTYYKYRAEWSNGTVNQGQKFHVGVSYEEAFEFYILDAYLTKDGSELPLKPRMLSYSYNYNQQSGDFDITIENDSDAAILVRNLRFLKHPRLVSMNDLMYAEVIPYSDEWSQMEAPFELNPGEKRTFLIANLFDYYPGGYQHFGLADYDGEGLPPGDIQGPLPPRPYSGLFPSTYILGEAQIEDPADPSNVSHISFERSGTNLLDVPPPPTGFNTYPQVLLSLLAMAIGIALIIRVGVLRNFT